MKKKATKANRAQSGTVNQSSEKERFSRMKEPRYWMHAEFVLVSPYGQS